MRHFSWEAMQSSIHCLAVLITSGAAVELLTGLHGDFVPTTVSSGCQQLAGDKENSPTILLEHQTCNQFIIVELEIQVIDARSAFGRSHSGDQALRRTVELVELEFAIFQVFADHTTDVAARLRIRTVEILHFIVLECQAQLRSMPYAALVGKEHLLAHLTDHDWRLRTKS